MSETEPELTVSKASIFPAIQSLLHICFKMKQLTNRSKFIHLHGHLKISNCIEYVSKHHTECFKVIQFFYQSSIRFDKNRLQGENKMKAKQRQYIHHHFFLSFF